MTDIEIALTELAKTIIRNNLRTLNQSIEDFNNLLNKNPEMALQNLSMLSKEDQQTPVEFIEKLINAMNWRLPDGTLDTTKIYLDPCCGRGGILAYLNSHYNIPKENLYGIELKQENVTLCNKLGFTVIKGNALDKQAFNEIKAKIKTIKGDNIMLDINRILMNPPYASDLHLKVLNSAKANCPNAELANISPVAPLYEYFAYGRPNVLQNMNSFHINEIIPEQEAEKSFGLSNIGSDLGIWTSKPTSGSTEADLCLELFGNKTGLIRKLWQAFSSAEKLSKHTKKFSSCTTSMIIKFVYGLSLSNHGLETPSSYNITSLNLSTASTGLDSTHTRYVECNSTDEQKIIHDLYCSTIMRFFYKEVLRGRCDYNLIPWFNPADITPDVTSFLTDFCKLSQDELDLINITMKPYKVGE